jgi:hypothetical protein
MNVFNLPNPYSLTMALVFTQPLTEMSTRNRKMMMILGSKVRLACWVDNLAAICELIV